MNLSFKTSIIIFYVVFVSWIFTPISTDRILAVSTVAAKSHWNVMSGVLRSLTDRGHNVTVFTSFFDGNRENYTEIDSTNGIEIIFDMNTMDAMKEYGSIVKSTRELHVMSRNSCISIFDNKIMKDILADNSKHQFDVLITETLCTECISTISTILDIPLIYVSTAPVLLAYTETLTFGHIPNPAVVSHLMSVHDVPKKFLERTYNTLLTMFTSCIIWYVDQYAKIYDTQPFDLLETTKPSIVFTNTHHITDVGRPLPSNIIPIAGIHLSPPKNIPNDILEFIENSPRGVILFTLGSVATVSTLPEHIQKIIKEVLAQVPQRVLIKYEDQMKDKPENVMTTKWIPQRDILLHPNVKLFISHGGISGTYEAVDAGVPVIGFPLFFDQSRNIETLVNVGMAISLDLMSLTKNTFLNAIHDTINNTEFSKNAKLTSKLFKDRPMSQKESVIYWTEYVIRHKGAPHFKSYSHNLSWYQYCLLDVISIILFVLILMFYVLCLGYRFCNSFISK